MCDFACSITDRCRILLRHADQKPIARCSSKTGTEATCMVGIDIRWLGIGNVFTVEPFACCSRTNAGGITPMPTIFNPLLVMAANRFSSQLMRGDVMPLVQQASRNILMWPFGTKVIIRRCSLHQCLRDHADGPFIRGISGDNPASGISPAPDCGSIPDAPSPPERRYPDTFCN